MEDVEGLHPTKANVLLNTHTRGLHIVRFSATHTRGLHVVRLSAPERSPCVI